MSSSRCALLSATFWEAGHDHLVELVHQRDTAEKRRLTSLSLTLIGADGRTLTTVEIDPAQEMLDLAALAEATVRRDAGRVMALFDARYDERVFPYRPHHYAYLHRRGSATPPLYYAVNAVLGGVPDRIGATAMNNFETYVFMSGHPAEGHAVLLGNAARFSDATAHVTAYYDGQRVQHDVALAPRAHAEIPLASEQGGHRLTRVDLKAPFRLASYVVGRRGGSGELVVFDHLFTYNK